jgi:hypothetical protein
MLSVGRRAMRMNTSWSSFRQFLRVDVCLKGTLEYIDDNSSPAVISLQTHCNPQNFNNQYVAMQRSCGDITI